MNKKLIIAALAAGLMLPGLAAADVKIYGRISQEFSNESTDGIADGTGGDDQNDGTGINDDAGTSRWGIKVSEKLGNGLTAFGKLEFKVYPGDRRPETERDQYVGLKGSWGAVSLGTHPTVWKQYGGTSLDLWNATHLNARRMGGAMGTSMTTNDFMGNIIQYRSPKMNGFQFLVQVMPDERDSAGAASDQGGDEETDVFLGVKYKTKVFEVGSVYQKDNNSVGSAKDTNGGTGDGRAWKIYGTYKFGNGHQILGRYADFDCGGVNGAVQFGSNSLCSGASDRGFSGTTNYGGIDPDAGTDVNVWYLAYRYKFGNNTFAIQTGNTDQDSFAGRSGVDTDYLAIGLTHKFSKRTRVFGGFARTDVNFDNAGNTDTALGDADRDAWTLGIRHDF